jgi:Mg2+ and Co2+ transporter CorA
VLTICAEWLNISSYLEKRLISVEILLDKVWAPKLQRDNCLQSLYDLGWWRRQLPLCRAMIADMVEQALPKAAQLTKDMDPSQIADVLEDIMPDIKRILANFDDLQCRLDRLFNRRTNEMQLEAATESLNESHNLARLSWLATIFVPMTFVSGLFSVNADISSLSDSFHTYVSCAIPAAFVALSIAKHGSDMWRFLAKHVWRPVLGWLEDRGLKARPEQY